MIKEDNKRITITLSKELYDLIKADAEYDDRSKSYVVVRILKNYYKLKPDDE